MVEKTEDKNKKTRDQPLLSYLESLQKEYLVAEIRSKIYPNKKDKIFWRDRVMEGKKKKVQDITSRNNMRDIFNCPYTRKDYEDSIYNDEGMPDMVYRDEDQRQLLESQDWENYYLPQSEVRIKGVDGNNYYGKIQNTDLEDNKCWVKFLNDESEQLYEFDLRKVTRIL